MVKWTLPAPTVPFYSMPRFDARSDVAFRCRNLPDAFPHRPRSAASRFDLLERFGRRQRHPAAAPPDTESPRYRNRDWQVSGEGVTAAEGGEVPEGIGTTCDGGGIGYRDLWSLVVGPEPL
jgi:hypothetical protein